MKDFPQHYNAHGERTDEHCWHLVRSFDGHGIGVEEHQCCWCGIVETRKWTARPDPKHGSYVPRMIREYE